MLKIEDVTKTYATAHGPVAALAGVSAEIKKGEFAVVRGPSGCGKTTLLLMLGGMLHPTSGGVTVAERKLYEMPAGTRAQFRSEHIGFVFQMFHLVNYLSVLENVLLAGGSRGPR